MSHDPSLLHTTPLATLRQARARVRESEPLPGSMRARRAEAKARRAEHPTQWGSGSRRQALYILVCLMLLVGLALVVSEQWRKGLVVMGASFVIGGVVRGALPARLTGWLAVRNRTSDLVFYLLFGITLIVTAIVARG